MNIKVTRPTKFKLGSKVVTVSPHDAAIKVSDAVGKKLLDQNPTLKRVKR